MIPLGLYGAARPVAAGPTILAFDSFNRADGALGNADTGQAWSDSGVAIMSNRAKCDGTNRWATVDVAASTVKASVDITTSLATGSGPVIRATGTGTPSRYWRLLWWTDGNWYIAVSAGTNANRRIWAQAAPALGDTIALSAEPDGANLTLKAWLNGTVVQTYTETNATYVAVAGTRAGFFGASDTVHVDNFTVEAM